MNIEYAIIVKNRTRLEALIERFNTRSQAKFYIESLGGDFNDYQIKHDNFYRSLDNLQANLSKIIKNKLLNRSHLPNYIFSENNIIIVIGQDGLVANTAKYSKGVPIVAVNPDKERYDGILLPFDSNNFIVGVEKVIRNNYQSRKLNFAEAKLNDGQTLLAFNDLFVGAKSHTSARYSISYQGYIEEQSSSGIIVSTKAGATGWLSSVFNMAYGIAHQFEQIELSKRPRLNNNQLMFAVREPFKSVKTSTEITCGFVNRRDKLFIESYMPSNGVIFSDGIEKDFIHFNSGSKVSIGISNQVANLVLKEKVVV